MASTRNPLNDFILTPQQQSLLFAALNSNKQQTVSPVTGTMNMSPSSYTTSPQKPESNAYQESPFLDLDYELSGDNGFDFSFADDSQAKMIGDLPGSNASEASARASSDNNDNEKRSHPDDENDEPEGSAKRQETGDKAPKKPGRKPLTTEPTSVSCRPSLSTSPRLTCLLSHPETKSTEQGRTACIPGAQRKAPQRSRGQGCRARKIIRVRQPGEFAATSADGEDACRAG